MIGNLTPQQMEEPRSEYSQFMAQVELSVAEGILTEHDAEAFTPYSDDLNDYIVKHEDGVYEYVNWYGENRSFSWELDENTFANDFRAYMQKRMKALDNDEPLGEFDFPGHVADYGTCDSFDQVWEAYPQLLTDPRHFILRVHKVHKKDQSPKGGWRWEKNGEYLGTKSECDYLYDEPNIDFVWVFQIIQVKAG